MSVVSHSLSFSVQGQTRAEIDAHVLSTLSTYLGIDDPEKIKQGTTVRLDIQTDEISQESFDRTLVVTQVRFYGTADVKVHLY